MGLAEKRLAKEIQENKLPEVQKTINEAVGKPVQIEIDWATFTAYDSYPLSRLDIVFRELKSAIKKVCKDEMGKEALQESLDSIHLTNIEDPKGVSMEFADKKLQFTVQLVGGMFNCYQDTQISKFIEEKL